MAGFDDIINQYINDPLVNSSIPLAPKPIVNKKETVLQNAEEKKSKLLTPYDIAAGRANNIGNASVEDPIQRDTLNLNTWDLLQKYGPDVSELIAERARSAADYRADVTSDRSNAGNTLDLATGVGSGFVNSIGGIGALGLGLVNDDAGVWASEKLEDFNEFTQGIQSDGLNNRRRANQALSNLQKAENEDQYERDLETDGNILASLKRIGRDTVDSGGNVLNDGALLSDTVASGVGSLLAGGPISKGLKAAGKAVLTKAGASTTGRIATIGSRASMPAAIGSMEAGGAYQQAVNDAYATLADRTDLTDDEKAERANQAGLLAAAIQGPIGAASSMLVSKFEAAPLAVPSIRSAAGNILKETIEEGIQSGSSQLAVNTGVREFADPNRNLVDDIGENIALGAIGGMGAAGAVQTPGVALRSAVKAGKLAISPIVALGKRGDDIIAQNEANSPISEEALSTAFNAAVADVPNITASVEDALSTSNISNKDDVLNYVNELTSLSTFDKTMLDDPMMGDQVRTVLSDATDRMDVVRRLATVINMVDENSPEYLNAGIYLYDVINNINDIINKNPDVLDALPANHPASKMVEDFGTVASRLQDMPKVIKAISTINKLFLKNLSNKQEKQN